MPINKDRPNPKIKIIFQGFVISRVKQGNEFAEVGALSTSHCHKPKISVLRTVNGDTQAVENLVFDIDKDIEVRVENGTEKTITEYTKGDFDRVSDKGDKNDFRWSIDLEKLVGPEIEVIPGRLKPVFRVNSAVFYTETRTRGAMKLRRKDVLEPFGRAAEQIAANIYLDSRHGRAVLRNGIVDLLTIEGSEKDTSYLIIFNCECHQDIGESDFALISDVIKLKPDEPANAGTSSGAPPLDFSGEPIGLHFVNSPEVPCFGGNLRSH